MIVNLKDLVDRDGKWQNRYNAVDAAGVVVARNITASEAQEKYSGPQYQFQKIHQVFIG